MRALELVGYFDHVHRNSNGARLLRHGEGDRLANPPGCIGRELESHRVVESLDRLDQPDVAFLDQVHEMQFAVVDVFLGDKDDEAQVALHHLGFGVLGLQLPLADLVDGVTKNLLGHVGLCLHDSGWPS
jgi:hypothetical protein